MLILSRRKGQKLVIRINDEVVAEITLLKFDNQGGVRLGFQANPEVVIMRKELDCTVFPQQETANV